MDRGAWRVTVPGVAKSRTPRSTLFSEFLSFSEIHCSVNRTLRLDVPDPLLESNYNPEPPGQN